MKNNMNKYAQIYINKMAEVPDNGFGAFSSGPPKDPAVLAKEQEARLAKARKESQASMDDAKSQWAAEQALAAKENRKPDPDRIIIK